MHRDPPQATNVMGVEARSDRRLMNTKYDLTESDQAKDVCCAEIKLDPAALWESSSTHVGRPPVELVGRLHAGGVYSLRTGE